MNYKSKLIYQRLNTFDRFLTKSLNYNREINQKFRHIDYEVTQESDKKIRSLSREV